MGCFNSYGFMSNLPIMIGDDVFALICVRYKPNTPMIDTESYINSPYLTPICFPLFGKYDEYGSVDNIVEDEMYRWLYEKTGIEPAKVIKIITDNTRRVPSKSERTDYEDIKCALLGSSVYDKWLDIVVTIDYKDVYNSVSGLVMDNVRAAYDIAIENEHILTDFYNIEKFDDFDAQEKSKSEYISKFNHSWNSDALCINPAIKSGYWGNWGDDFSGYMLLESFKESGSKEQGFWKDDKWKESYIRFMSFYWALVRMHHPITLFRRGGQAVRKDWFKMLNKAYDDIIEKNLYKRPW